jgi:erythritol kinase
MNAPLILALDSGTSVVKAVAFDATGRVLAEAARPNTIAHLPDGGAEQDMAQTWRDAAAVLATLAGEVAGSRIVALAVTGQGDGTWLVDADGEPAAPALLWLDGRARGIVERRRADGTAAAAFTHTGSGLNTCQQSSQLLWLAEARPAALARAATALHCKDWLYFKLTGVRATDPSEACFTFGDWRTRDYCTAVLEALDLAPMRRLLPPILDGTQRTHPLTRAAAEATGLPTGLPVALAPVDVVCTALGGGIFGAGEAGVTILGSTGMHLRLAATAEAVRPSAAMTGYCMCFPVPRHVMQAQSNMAATLNIDWLIDLFGEGFVLTGQPAPPRAALREALERAAAEATPGALLFHPFISPAGERGPFNDPFARADLLGLDAHTRVGDIARAVLEGLGFAARDCYDAMGGAPAEVRLSGGAARSATMRSILAACLDRPVRRVAQNEAGAAGAAMVAALGIGLFDDMARCAAQWVAPLLQAAEPPPPAAVARVARLYPLYRDAYRMMPVLWRGLAAAREDRDAV